MSISELVSMISKQGIGIVAVGAGIWMLWYLVRFTVVQMGTIMGDLVVKMDVFMSHVRVEHEEHSDRISEVAEKQQQSREQHLEMMTQMREITSTLGRINGYKKE